MASATKFSEIPNASITQNGDGTNSPNVFAASSGSGATADQVQGTAADGAAAVGKPVQVGGKDDSGNAQTIHTDTSGNLIVVGAADDGAAVAVGAPVQMGGKTDSGGIQSLFVDDEGKLKTQITGINLNYAWVGVPSDVDASNTYVLYTEAQESRYNGVTWERLRTPNKGKYIQLASSAAEQNIWTPAAGKKFRLMGFILTTDVDCNLTFRDNPTGALIFLASAKALVPAITPPNLINGFLSGNINRILTIQASAAATIFGTVFGCEE